MNTYCTTKLIQRAKIHNYFCTRSRQKLPFTKEMSKFESSHLYLDRVALLPLGWYHCYSKK